MQLKFTRKRIFGILTIFLGTPPLLALMIADRFTHPPWYYHTSRTPEQGLNLAFSFDNWMNVSSNPKQAFNIPYEEVLIPGPYDSILQGWFINSSKPSDKVIVTVHGGGSDRREFLRILPIFYKNGFNVLMFDCREHGISSGTFKGLSFGIREHNDVIHAVKFAQKRYNLTKIAVIGTSQGGTSVILAASKEDSIKAVIAENPFSSLSELVGDVIDLTLAYKPEWASEVGWTSFIVSMGNYVPDWFRALIKHTVVTKVVALTNEGAYLNAIDVVDSLNKPLFLMHGTEDRMVSVGHSERLFKKAKEPKHLWIAKGAQHSRIFNKFPKEYEQKVLGFLRFHL